PRWRSRRILRTRSTDSSLPACIAFETHPAQRWQSSAPGGIVDYAELAAGTCAALHTTTQRKKEIFRWTSLRGMLGWFCSELWRSSPSQPLNNGTWVTHSPVLHFPSDGCTPFIPIVQSAAVLLPARNRISSWTRRVR